MRASFKGNRLTSGVQFGFICGSRFGDKTRRPVGRIPKWPTGADCKSAGLRLHWFESNSYHHCSSLILLILNRFFARFNCAFLFRSGSFLLFFTASLTRHLDICSRPFDESAGTMFEIAQIRRDLLASRRQVPRFMNKKQSQVVAAWVFGSSLLVFYLCVFLFGPSALPEFKQRMLGLFSALLAGLL